MMFSATFPRDARAVAKEYMANDHIRIRVGRTGSTYAHIQQRVSLSSLLIITITDLLDLLCRRAPEAESPS